MEGQSSNEVKSPLEEALESKDDDAPKGEQGEGDQKPKDEKKPDESGEGDQKDGSGEEPQEYEITLSETSPLSDEDLDEIVKLAEENEWTQEQAEAAIKERETYYQRGSEAANRPRIEYYQTQKESFDKDPEFNGEKKVATYQSIAKAVDVFGSDELKAQLSRPEIGHNYALAKFLKSLGDEITKVQNGGDGSILLGKGSAGGGESVSEDQQALRNMYPDFWQEEKSS